MSWTAGHGNLYNQSLDKVNRYTQSPGASFVQIVSILSKGFVKLVTIAFIIATPLSWWAIHAWLEIFVLRTTESWWIFLLSGIGMIIVALITLGVQTIRAAMANPAVSLRTE